MIHFGGQFISKELLTYVASSKPSTYLHISHHGEIFDPEHLVTKRLVGEITLNIEPRYGWLNEWKEESIYDPLFSNFEMHFPDVTSLFIGNSLPIRQANASFFPKNPIKVFANRGLSGIDGNIATAAGIAKARAGKTVAIIGDQTFLHDLNSLSLARDLTLVVINNGGGRIFEQLPIGKQTALCEKYFINAHTMTFEHIAKQFGMRYAKEISPEPGIIELCTTNTPAL